MKDTVRRPRRLRAGLTVFALVLGAFTSFNVAVATSPANAADGSQFNPGFIISDENFFNSSAMTSGEVQSFLNGKLPSCSGANGQPCLRDYAQATPTVGASAYCATYSGSARESAALIIQKVGVACGINPQVLLVTLQKEVGLVTDPAPTAGEYRKAMGYACPDTADCDSAYYGFFNQVYSAAAAFHRYNKTGNYTPGQVNTILWHPDRDRCGSSSVYIQNQATANLYTYTPYQPNTAALGNMYGTGDACSSYGNRNFWRYFSDWFGSPTEGKLASPSFEGRSTAGWGASNGFINQLAVNSPSQAKHGDSFLATNTPTAYRAISQDVKTNIGVGRQATAKVWVRSESTRPFTGVVALWGLGGSNNEQANTPFTVTDAWTEVTVKLPMRTSAHSIVRLDIYLLSTDGSLWIDNTSLEFGDAPPVQNMLQHPSFEGSFAGWAPGNGFMNQQIFNDPSIVKQGAWFAASNTPAPGRSFAQEVAASPSRGDQYTFRIWLRGQNGAKPFAGKVALWGLGGSQQVVSVTDFTVTGTWQEVTVTLDVNADQVRMLKPEVYLSSTDNTLFLDDALLGKNLLSAGSFEGGASTGWGTGNGQMNFQIYGSHGTNQASSGGFFAATNTTVAGGSIAQAVSRKTSVGDFYTAEVWVRSADPNKTFSGTLALWVLGGATEASSTPFTANGAWQRVRVHVPVGIEDHTQLKFEIYLGTTQGENTLFVDAAQIY